MRDTDDHELGPSVTHFFNCFFGNSQVVSEKSSGSNFLRRSQKKVSIFGKIETPPPKEKRG